MSLKYTVTLGSWRHLFSIKNSENSENFDIRIYVCNLIEQHHGFKNGSPLMRELCPKEIIHLQFSHNVNENHNYERIKNAMSWEIPH